MVRTDERMGSNLNIRSGRQLDGPRLFGSRCYKGDRDRAFFKLGHKSVGGAQGGSSSLDVSY